MGNSASRFSHGVRDAMRACSGKRRRKALDEDDEARLSTYESEPLDRAWVAPGESGGHERAVSVSRTGSRASSLARLHDGKMEPNAPCGRLASVSPRLGSRGSPRIQPSNFHQYQQHLHVDFHPGVSYQPLVNCLDCNSTGISASLSPCCCRRSRPWLVDQESQTSIWKSPGLPNEDSMPYLVEPVLSKEYIVKTYSIQNATPSPSPSTQSKFTSPEADTPSGLKTRLQHVREWTPSPPSTLQRAAAASTAPQFTGPLAALEQRQEGVLRRLEEMQATVAQLEQKFKVKDTTVASSSSTSAAVSADSGSGLQKFVGEPGRILDLAISTDPSSIPLSLVALAEQISCQYTTLLSTFVHSSVASTNIPGRLQQLLKSNGGRSRAECQVAVTLVWKKVSNGPQLVVDPVHQTSIQGEVNVARYLWGLLNTSGSDGDAARATLEDELVDLAQLQVVDGNSKERAAAIRKLNSILGKQNVWLMGGDTPSLADMVCWSVLHQTNLVQGAPANVQRWLTGCKQHKVFATAQELADALIS